MERKCNNSKNEDLYIPDGQFKNNYAQMKLDAPKSHGHVFDNDGDTVTIWPKVTETLYHYRDFFTK